MATNVQQIISNLGDGLTSLAAFAGGSVPSTSDTEYSNWRSWLNQGQEDAAQRGFWGRLLTNTTLSITADDNTVDLPDNFHKRNGIYILEVDGIDWASPNNSDGQTLFVNLDPTTGVWQVRFSTTPTTDATATLWYFYLPPKMVAEEDLFFLDGKMCVFYAMAEYYRQSGELGSLDDARAEYNNRFNELLGMEMLPSKQELLQWSSVYDLKNTSPNEKQFYLGRSNRTGRR